MKTLYESILDVDKDWDNDLLINLLFSKDIQQRRDAFESLLNLITSYGTKQQKTTTKMKNSDSYFIQFTKSFKVKNGEVVDELMDYISYIYICKRTSPYGYRVIERLLSTHQMNNLVIILMIILKDGNILDPFSNLKSKDVYYTKYLKS